MRPIFKTFSFLFKLVENRIKGLLHFFISSIIKQKNSKKNFKKFNESKKEIKRTRALF